VLEDSAHRVWVGTSRGLSLYHPKADIEAPKTLLIGTDSPLESRDEQAVRLVFQGTDKWRATAADRLLYSHRLDEREWSGYTAATSVTFTNLSPGDHRFEVRAMDRNWNTELRPAMFEFSVILPWYREPRLLGVAVTGLAAALFFAGLAINRHLQLRRSYARVEKMVEERTRDLEHATQALAQSQKMTALGTLAAGVAHDFSNILSIIKGSAQIIENNLDDAEKIRTRVSRIKTMVDQGSGIVRAMLGFGRVSDKRPTALDVRIVVEETLRLMGERFLREVEVVTECETDLPLVLGVKDLMQQMLLNLTINAAEASTGRGRILVGARHSRAAPANPALPPAPSGEYVLLFVHDSGCGIAPEILPRIFEPFFTTKAMSTRRGTGLGLYMVYEFAKEMGHGLNVESRPGQGSTFTIILPVVDALPPVQE
jgi:signal transduction histidine kinase